MNRFETIRSTCRYTEGKRLWLGRATLTATAVKITGWHGFKRYARRVLLDDLQSVSRRPETARSNIAFRLVDGSVWSAEVSAPGLWRIEAAQRIRAINPNRLGDGDEVVMSVSSWPLAEEEEDTLEAVGIDSERESPVHGETSAVPEPVRPDEAFHSTATAAPGDDLLFEEPAEEEPMVEPQASMQPTAEVAPIEETFAEEPAWEEPVVEEAQEGEAPLDEPSAAVEPVVDERILEEPKVEEWLDGVLPTPSIEESLPDVELLDPVETTYSLIEAYSAATEPVESDEEQVRGWTEPDAPSAETSAVSEQETAPGWRPIHLIVSGKRVGSAWQSIDDLESRP